MRRRDAEAEALLSKCLHNQAALDDEIGKLGMELGERIWLSSATANRFVQRAATAATNANWIIEEIGRLDYFGVKGRRLSLPAEAFLIGLTRGGIQEATANVLANVALTLAQNADDTYTAKAIAKLNNVQSWKQRYDGNGWTRRVKRRFRRWALKWSGAAESPSGRDIDSRVDSVETGLRRVYTLDTIDFFSVPGLSAVDEKSLKGTPYERGLRLLEWVAEGGAKPDAKFGYREIILAATTHEIQLGQVNASHLVYITKALLAAVRAVAYFCASQELAIAGDTQSSARAAVAANEDLRRARDSVLWAARHAWCDTLLLRGRPYPKPPFQMGASPDGIEHLVGKLSVVMGLNGDAIGK